jgi:hypothetical protein
LRKNPASSLEDEVKNDYCFETLSSDPPHPRQARDGEPCRGASRGRKIEVKSDYNRRGFTGRCPMKRYILVLVLLFFVSFGAGCTVYQAAPAYGHEPPPRVVVSQPEYLYLIPSYGVYFVPNISAEVFFVNGRWYYSARGIWYWGGSYRGPWTRIEVRHVPRHLRSLPRDYRKKYHRDYYRVPYGHWEKRRYDLPPKAEHRSPPYVERFKRNVYILPQNPDVVFHDGAWYRKYKGTWYEGKSSTGPWRYQDIQRVPKTIKKLPPDYRQPKPGKPYKKVPWPEVQKKYKKKIQKKDREWGDY